ncbi:MAG: hypothetical protein HFE63_07825 [Clostridiales bacterium]|nr:hypothetical protein [Clostridiales bacterium]
MKYILDEDLKYLQNKYHDTNAPFDSLARFICYDGEYDMSTGLNAEAMEAGLSEYTASLPDTDHSMIKAKAFRYVIENTPIDVNPHDYYVSIHSANRVINRVLVIKWSNEVFSDILPDANSKLDRLRCDGAVASWPDYDHSVPNYDYIIPLGFTGMLDSAKEAEADFIKRNGSIGENERAYFDSIYIELEAILLLLDRLIDYAKRHPNAKTSTVLPALESLRSGAPKNTYEVLMFIYVYFMCSEHIEGLQVRSLSNLDRMLYPFYKADIESGRFSEAEIRRFIAYFYIQFSAIGNYWGQPMYLGGTNADGSSAINELSYLLLDVYDGMNIYSPKIQIKYSSVTPRDFLLKVLDMIRRGHNSLVFVCEETMHNAMMKFGATAEEARLANIVGCYEYSTREEVVSMGAYINLAKFVEYTLFNGTDPKTGRNIGISLGEAESFDTFDKLTEAFLKYVLYAVDTCIEQVNRYEAYYGYVNPMPLFSSTRMHSLKVAKDAYSAGAEHYRTSYHLGCTANTADSLAMIKKYVYDSHEISMTELKSALKADFVGYEELRTKLLGDTDKYGNNKGLAEGIAEYINGYIADHINGIPDGRGGVCSCGLHIARQYFWWKDCTGSTPDGRVRGTELAKNASPVQGMAQSGATAVILAITRLDATKFISDCSADICLHPGSIAGDEGLNAMLALLDVYRIRGGHAVHFNVLDVDTLRKAQDEPEKYRDLQIRVCGWNALFTSMNRTEQDGFIRAAEAAGS